MKATASLLHREPGARCIAPRLHWFQGLWGAQPDEGQRLPRDETIHLPGIELRSVVMRNTLLDNSVNCLFVTLKPKITKSIRIHLTCRGSQVTGHSVHNLVRKYLQQNRAESCVSIASTDSKSVQHVTVPRCLVPDRTT